MTQEQKKQFFNRYKWAAIWEHIYSGVPASVTLAQAAVESNYGTSSLFKNANNAFGIKAYSNPDNLPVYYATDDAINEPFRKYKTVRDSFADHSDFLQENPRYSFLFNSDSAYYWADGLKQAGYATSPTYPALLKNVIDDNDLIKYDFYGNNKYLILFGAILFLICLGLLIYLLYKKYSKK